MAAGPQSSVSLCDAGGTIRNAPRGCASKRIPTKCRALPRPLAAATTTIDIYRAAPLGKASSRFNLRQFQSLSIWTRVQKCLYRYAHPCPLPTCRTTSPLGVDAVTSYPDVIRRRSEYDDREKRSHPSPL